jgi:hypothetical protein
LLLPFFSPRSDEEATLKEMKEKNGSTWATIARSFIGRTENACLKYYSLHLKEGMKQKRAPRNAWTVEEEERLKELRKERGMTFAKIAGMLRKEGGRRTAEACQKRCKTL